MESDTDDDVYCDCGCEIIYDDEPNLSVSYCVIVNTNPTRVNILNLYNCMDDNCPWKWCIAVDKHRITSNYCSFYNPTRFEVYPYIEYPVSLYTPIKSGVSITVAGKKHIAIIKSEFTVQPHSITVSS